MNSHDGGTPLPLIKEIAPFKQPLISPKNKERNASPPAYYLDINKFLPSLKLFKQNSSSSSSLQHKKSSYFCSLENHSLKTPKKSYLVSPKKKETQIIVPKNNNKADLTSMDLAQSERSEYYLPLKTVETKGASIEYSKKLKKIDKISSHLLPLSKESFYDEYHMKLYELSLNSSSKTAPKKIEPSLLKENIRAQIEDVDKSIHYFYIKTEYNGLPIKINVNSHKGNYVCCVNFRELAKLESHDFIFNNTPFIIESESLYMFDKVFLTIIAMKDFKISVSYCFVNNETELETSIRKNSQLNDEALLLSTTSLEKNREGISKIADDEFYKGCEIKKQNLVFRNKHIAKNYDTLKKAIFYKNKEEMIIKKNKAIYNNDKIFFQDINEKLIKYYKKRTKILEVFALEKEKIARKNYNFFLIEWLKLLQLVKFIDLFRERFKINKTLKRFLAYKELMANKIQRLFRRAINKSKIRIYNKRMHLNIFQSLIFQTNLLKKKVKCNAKKIIANFLKEAKRPMNIFLHIFKTLMKIVFMKNKMKLLRKSHLQRMLHLNRIWNEEMQKIMKTKNEAVIYYLDKLTNNDKENALRDYLNKKKMEYFYQIQEFLNKKAIIGKKRTLALRFIESVQEKETSYEDIELNEMTKESLLYRSISPKSQTKIFKEKTKDFYLNVNKADSPYQRKDSKAVTLAHIKTHINIPNTFGNAMNNNNNNFTLESINTPRNEIPDHHSFLDKPIFKYLPTAEEMKEIILKTVGEIKKRQLG